VVAIVVVGSSWFASAFLVVNAALGAGLLNFPAAYDQSGGLVVAIGIQLVSRCHYLTTRWTSSRA
jgi:hypothetical protein